MHEVRSRPVPISWLVGVLLVISALVVAASGPVQAKPKKGSGALVCGSTVTADVHLNADMYCSGVGLVVGAANITIDLNNHAIVGAGTGILNDGFANVTVERGELSGFFHAVEFNGVNGGAIRLLTMTWQEPIYGVTGIDLEGSQNVTVAGNHISDPSFGGMDFGGHDNHWISNRIDAIGHYDRQVGVAGIAVASHNTDVKDNFIYGGNTTTQPAASFGVIVLADALATGSVIDDNVVRGHGAGILLLEDVTGVTVRRNTGDKNLVGLEAFSPKNSLIEENAFRQNAGAGISLRGPTNVTLKGNTTSNNFTGVEITGSGGAILIGNDANSNSHYGFTSEVPINSGNVAPNYASGNGIANCHNVQPCT